MLFSSRKFLPLHGVESVHVPAVLVHISHAVCSSIHKVLVQGVHLLLKSFVRKHLKLRSLEVLPRVVGVLDHVVGGVGLDEPDNPLNTAERSGGPASLQDHPSLGHKERTLGQNVGINLAVGHERNDLTLGNHQHFLQSSPGY